MTSIAAEPVVNDPDYAGWQAKLVLIFSERQGHTYVRHRRHIGPLLIQRPFYPEGGVSHTYLLHPPGGVVAGDRLCLEVQVDRGAHALMTTPSAGKFYSSAGDSARFTQHFSVNEGGALEWLPQETLVFEDARAELDTCIELAENASYLGWEIICFGRPAAGTGFGDSRWLQRLKVVIGGHVELLERLSLDPDSPLLDAAWGMQGARVSATLVCASPRPVDLDDLHAEGLGVPPAGLGGVTCMDHLLVARYLGTDVAEARAWFESLWQWLRPRVFDRPACSPRIWRT